MYSIVLVNTYNILILKDLESVEHLKSYVRRIIVQLSFLLILVFAYFIVEAACLIVVRIFNHRINDKTRNRNWTRALRADSLEDKDTRRYLNPRDSVQPLKMLLS